MDEAPGQRSLRHRRPPRYFKLIVVSNPGFVEVFYKRACFLRLKKRLITAPAQSTARRARAQHKRCHDDEPVNACLNSSSTAVVLKKNPGVNSAS